MADEKNEIEELPEFEELLALTDGEEETSGAETAGDLREEMDLPEDEADESAQLRVVEDEELPEVIRLEELSVEEPKDLSKKVKPRGEREFLNTMMNDGAAKVAEREAPLSHRDDEWMESEPRGASGTVPIGWFILVIGVLGLILCWGAYQLGFSEKEVVVVDKTAGDLSYLGYAETPLGKGAEEKERAEAEESYAELEDGLRAYFAAATIEEKLKYVRHPKRVESLMRDYYSRHELVVEKYEEIINFQILALESKPFIGLSVQVATRDVNAVILAEKTSDGTKFDWESEVCYQPMALEEFLEERPTEAVEFRVYALQDHYFSYEFRDEKKWLCYRLSELHGEEYLFGYLPIEQEETMAKIMNDQGNGRPLMRPLILKLRFPEGGRGPRSVMIDEIVAEMWAYPNNPDEKKAQ